MGGFGSGRFDQIRTKGSLSDVTCIDIRSIDRDMRANPHQWIELETRETSPLYARVDGQSLQISQQTTSEIRVDAELKLQRDLRHFGGSQTYMLCPCCERRFCVLYFMPPKEIGCRKCLDLAYDSQYYTHPAPLLVRANKLRQRLGGRIGLLNEIPRKPKNMHWATYLRLAEEIRQLESAHLVQFDKHRERMLQELIELEAKFYR